MNTDRGEVYTWGWKECVPSGKVFGDSSLGGTLEKDTVDKQSSVFMEQGNYGLFNYFIRLVWLLVLNDENSNKNLRSTTQCVFIYY